MNVRSRHIIHAYRSIAREVTRVNARAFSAGRERASKSNTQKRLSRVLMRINDGDYETFYFRASASTRPLPPLPVTFLNVSS